MSSDPATFRDLFSALFFLLTLKKIFIEGARGISVLIK